MKVTPVASPAQVQDLSTPDSVRTAKAVEAFNKGQSSYDKAPPQAQEHPVANPNAISAEELSAIKPQTQRVSDTPASESAEEVTTPAPKDPEVEKRMQYLARQERALRAKVQQQNQALKQREADLKAKEAELEAKYRQPDLSEYISKSRIKEDALSVLEEAGTNWDELTQQALSRQPTDPRVMTTIQKLEAKIQQLEKANSDSQQTQKQRDQAQYQAAVKQIKSDAKQLVYTDPEFETVKAMNAVNDVVELIERTYQEDGVVLSVEDAAKEVENYLVEEAMKVTQIDKIKKRLAAPKASELKTDEKSQTNQQKQPMKTLTNAGSSTRKISVRERAIARANGFTGDF